MLVLDDGKPVGIVTRSDLLGFLATPEAGQGRTVPDVVAVPA